MALDLLKEINDGGSGDLRIGRILTPGELLDSARFRDIVLKYKSSSIVFWYQADWPALLALSKSVEIRLGAAVNEIDNGDLLLSMARIRNMPGVFIKATRLTTGALVKRYYDKLIEEGQVLPLFERGKEDDTGVAAAEALTMGLHFWSRL